MTRDDVFRIIDEVEKDYLRNHCDNKNGVVKIEYIVPFVESDFGLSVWAFFSSDEDVSNAKLSGATGEFQQTFTAALHQAGYDSNWISDVIYTFDSIENVDKNFEGSFFYRLR